MATKYLWQIDAASFSLADDLLLLGRDPNNAAIKVSDFLSALPGALGLVVDEEPPFSWLSVDASLGVPTAGVFTLGLSSTPNFTGNPNVVHAIGWNINGAGIRVDNAKAAAWLGMAQDFEVSSGGPRTSVNSWNGSDTDGTPFTFISQTFQHGALATTSRVALRAQTTEMQREDGTPLARFDWNQGQTTFSAATGASGFFALVEGIDIGSLSNAGIFQFNPYANGINRDITWRFAGGSYEQFQFYQQGAALDLWAIGPSAGSSLADSLVLRTGKGIGLGCDPTSGSVAGQVVLKDGGKITASGTTTGIFLFADTDKGSFFGATPIAKPAVTGSWAGNAAGENLAAALANLGLITNNTTA